MSKSLAKTWTEQLSDEQREQLHWLQENKCVVEATDVPPDLLAELPAGLLLTVAVDKHIVIKERGTDISELFRQLFEAARLFLKFPKP
ncbi:hypothetical protein [Deinococcus peraridilitoris]|uniref:Uncharacterized protein n=1 Tax=Deinococcus peraridilitoris (strain DSM 19664 / LMG 22246 / CIP 109416 / KR-200) TaxID=937777 RepID=K9ZZ53_DEIPD|nr:hypothetical protein [Deinococcus peraridilitoris]AFZ66928.1 hypothetical protein Deipe_1383 [Deinococcus peraridilitoris DSM 19664]